MRLAPTNFVTMYYVLYLNSLLFTCKACIIDIYFICDNGDVQQCYNLNLISAIFHDVSGFPALSCRPSMVAIPFASGQAVVLVLVDESKLSGK